MKTKSNNAYTPVADVPPVLCAMPQTMRGIVYALLSAFAAFSLSHVAVAETDRPVAAVNADAGDAYALSPVLTNFNLAAGIIWKKFRKVKDKYVLGQPAEGKATALFRMSLASRNAELAAEARAILDAMAETRDVLGERLQKAREAGLPHADEWIRLYLKSYPSRRAVFAKHIKTARKNRLRNGL